MIPSASGSRSNTSIPPTHDIHQSSLQQSFDASSSFHAHQNGLSPGNYVQPHAFTFWLYKDNQSSSNIPESYLANTVGFAALNPTYSLDFFTNDTARLQAHFDSYFQGVSQKAYDAENTDYPASALNMNFRAPLETAYPNMRIAKTDFDFPDYPLTAKLAKASLSQHPHLSKDLQSVLVVQKHLYSENSSRKYSISFDPDTEWDTALPAPWHLNGIMAVHTEEPATAESPQIMPENGVMAFTHSSKETVNDLLAEIEDNILNIYSIKENPPSHTTQFTPLKELNYMEIVDETFFTSYSNILFDKGFYNDFRKDKEGVEDLSNHVEYFTPQSSYSSRNADKFIDYFEG